MSQVSSVTTLSSSTTSSLAVLRSSSLSQAHKLVRHTPKLTGKSKSETCSLCGKTMSSFFAHGYKCSSCQMVFHAKCVQQGVTAASQICESTVRRHYRAFKMLTAFLIRNF